MKPIITTLVITKAQLVAFIKSQRNNREIDFHEGSVHHSTGCLLQHFAKSRKLKFHHCSFDSIYGQWSINTFSTPCIAKIENGADIKDLLKEQSEWPAHCISHTRAYPLGSITYGDLKKMLK